MAYGDEIGSVPQLFLGSDFGDMTESQSSGRMTQGPDQTVVDGDIVAQVAAASALRLYLGGLVQSVPIEPIFAHKTWQVFGNLG
jgi:hypothetical protein